MQHLYQLRDIEQSHLNPVTMQDCETRASSGEDAGIVRQTTAAHFAAMSHYASPSVFSRYITTRHLIRCREGYVCALRGRGKGRQRRPLTLLSLATEQDTSNHVKFNHNPVHNRLSSE
jgi:hypothetical protein